ncbi:glucans biosynthesis glucosyltransferase MdoH [Babesia caballi]|uniref:Glucans biosynthesis glucosyltransferase MdoH n=1 Tax=Babesia caballi TaxID=5871 RepID=A0AAV4LY40_BABCB|nr:glucans biosynthesis glucosyltransferase MdoH [Babesia caballi]
MVAAETLKVVGEEGLERGSLAVGATVGADAALIVGAGGGVGTTGSILLTIVPTLRAVHTRIPIAYVGTGRVIGSRINLFSKPTMPPTAAIIKISETLLRQEGQLKLQSISVLRKLAQKRGTGRVREAHAVTEEMMKVGFLTFLGGPRPLKSTQDHRRIEAGHSEVTLQVSGTEGVGSCGRFTGVGDVE